MIEKLIVLEDIDPVIFYGVNNANIQLIKALYPKLRIVARGNVIKVMKHSASRADRKCDRIQCNRQTDYSP